MFEIKDGLEAKQESHVSGTAWLLLRHCALCYPYVIVPFVFSDACRQMWCMYMGFSIRIHIFPIRNLGK
jgi:hypothetical protein